MPSTSRRQGIRSLWFILNVLTATAHADPVQSFLWGFDTVTSTLLPECGRLQLFVNTSGGVTPPTPPYTFIAYEAGGFPTRQAVGSNITDLWWTVDHSSQSQLVLSMVDAAGNGGGVAPNLYTVLPSSSGTGCHSANPSSPVTLTTNLTKSLSSCDVLPLKMSGGTKPYTITIAPLAASVSINFTLGPQFDTLEWVNRASPDTELLASVSDAHGVYGGSTNLFSTSGSKDLTCGNRQSTQIDSTGQASGSSGSGNQPSQSSNSNSSKKSTSTTTILAAVVGSAVLIGAVLIGIFFCLRRRAHRTAKYGAVSTIKEFGSGGSRIPILDENDGYSNAAEMTSFVTTAGSGIPYPYTENPMYQGSMASRVTSEMSLGPEMQARASTYTVPANISPGASSFATQQSVAPSAPIPPPSGATSSYDPSITYAGGSVAPFSPLESTSTSIHGQLPGAAYAAYAGSVAESEARPSSAALAVGNRTARDSSIEKQGVVPPQTPRDSVYQHEDITDVVELPPAYKERTNL